MLDIRTIYLDLDGVCCQWWESVHRRFPDAPPIPAEGLLPYDISEFLEVPRWDIDFTVEDAGSVWWATLPEYSWFRPLYQYLSGFCPVIFLTAPGPFTHAYEGKAEWLRRRLGFNFDNFIITNHKQDLASAKSLLIDDTPRMVDAFTKAGGHSLLFPSRWNRLHEHCEDGRTPMNYIRMHLPGYFSRNEKHA